MNALAPGLVKTSSRRPCGRGPGEERIASTSRCARLGVPDDVATAALFLASDASSWVTGQTFVVDGGTTVQPSGWRSVSSTRRLFTGRPCHTRTTCSV